jgi:hypothetical protein
MKARLEDQIPELADRVIVYRRHDIESQFEQRMAKSKGRCVVIRLISAKNTSKADASFYEGNFTVSLFTVPLLTASDTKDADDLLAEIEAALNNWWPTTLKSNTRMKLKSGDITFRDENEFDIAQIIFTSPLSSLQAVTGDV